jgi:hypothetical protein
MKFRLTTLVMLLVLASTFVFAPFTTSAKSENKLLRNVKVTGTLSDGSTFSGKLTITNFAYDQTEGLVVSGELKGHGVKQTFTNVPVTLSQGTTTMAAGVQAMATCDILFLDLGPLFLDVLGLTVDLSQITLDIDAVSGAGNLLGNLLCGVTGLLDPLTGLLTFLDNLNQLVGILNQINDLLG